MDSRHDQILIGPTLRDGQGMAYLPEAPGGDTAAAYSQSTWDDPNHSHRAWGNDGSSYDTVLTTGGNTMVGPAIAQALINSAAGGGHLPVFLDLQVPAKLAPTPATADFGTVALGAAAQATIQVGNSADVALWSRDGTGFGIDSLTYTLTASAGFTAPAGTFNEAPDGAAGGNSHVIVMNTSTAGTKTGTLTITSDDPDSPTRVIALTGVVGSGSSFDYDVNDDGLVNTEDLHRWYGLFTDVTGNGTVDAADVAALRAELRRLEIADITAGRR
jgi:hypothetical protein